MRPYRLDTSSGDRHVHHAVHAPCRIDDTAALDQDVELRRSGALSASEREAGRYEEGAAGQHARIIAMTVAAAVGALQKIRYARDDFIDFITEEP